MVVVSLLASSSSSSWLNEHLLAIVMFGLKIVIMLVPRWKNIMENKQRELAFAVAPGGPRSSCKHEEFACVFQNARSTIPNFSITYLEKLYHRWQWQRAWHTGTSLYSLSLWLYSQRCALTTGSVCLAPTGTVLVPVSIHPLNRSLKPHLLIVRTMIKWMQLKWKGLGSRSES